VRKHTPEFAGGRLLPFHTHNPHVLGYQRPGVLDGEESIVVVLANVADTHQAVGAATLSGLPRTALELISGDEVRLDTALTLEPLGVRWLRV
jgi:amylosucrase